MADAEKSKKTVDPKDAARAAAIETKVRDLTEELNELIEQGDHLDALDVYEELDRLTRLTPQQLMAMGRSYLEVRRKTDARDTWIRAAKIDPDFREAIMELNRNFPGWRKEAPRIQAYGSTPEGAGAGLGAGEGGAGGGGAEGSEDKPEKKKPKKNVPALEIKMAAGISGDNAVNWDYIMADLEAARAEQKAARNEKKPAPATADPAPS